MKYFNFLISLMLMPVFAFADLTIALIGDSNTWGAPDPKFGWVSLLQEEIEVCQYPVKLINRGQCAATSDLLELILINSITLDHPDVVVLNVGLVDTYYGRPTKPMKDAVERMIVRCLKHNIKVLFGKIEVSCWKNPNVTSPNRLPQYIDAMNQVYVDLANNYPVISYDFLTSEILGTPGYHIGDRLHPNPEGYIKIYKVIREKMFDAFNSIDESQNNSMTE